MKNNLLNKNNRNNIQKNIMLSFYKLYDNFIKCRKLNLYFIACFLVICIYNVNHRCALQLIL